MMTMTKDNGSIQGIGIDTIEIDRIEKSVEQYGNRFLQRLFTEKEIAYCKRHAHQARHLAGRFAAKESVAKALGCGIGEKLSWKDIEILNGPSGKPEVFLAADIAQLFGAPVFFLSITHCKAYASAVAVWTKR